MAAHRRDPQVPLTSDTGAARAPRSRLDPAVFRLSLEKIRSGYYTDAYFNHAKALIEPRKSARPMTTARLAMIRGVRAVVTIYALVIVAGLGLYVIVGLTHG